MDEQLRHTLRLSVCCELCFEPYDGEGGGRQARVLGCGHTFCARCLTALVRAAVAASSPGRRCPSCRTPWTGSAVVEDLPRNYGLEGIATLLAPLLASDDALDGILQPRRPPPAPSAGAPAPLAAAVAGLQHLVLSPPQQAPALPPAAPVASAPAAPAAPTEAPDEQARREAEEARRLRERWRAAEAAAPAPTHAARPYPAALPAADVEAAVVEWVRAQGRPVPLVRVCNHLADRGLWPPAQLGTLLRQQQELRAAAEAAQRGGGGGGASAGRPFVVDVAALRTPSPSLLRGFLASRGALAASGGGAQGGGKCAGPPLHCEVGRANFAECLCAGGPECAAGNDALSRRRALAAVDPAPYVPPALRDGSGGRSAGMPPPAHPQRPGGRRDGGGFPDDFGADDAAARYLGHGDDDDDDGALADRLVRQGRGKGGRARR